MALCPLPAEGDIARITLVDECGAPIEGADKALVTECWATFGGAPNVEDGVDLDFRAANGRSCGFKRGRPSFRGFDITWEFFQASPYLVNFTTGSPLVLGWDGEAIGWDDCDDVGNFAFELWQNVAGEECPDDESEGLWLYWLYPWVSNGRLGDVTVSGEQNNFELTGNTRAGGRWSLGPWDVVAQDALGTAGPLLVPLGSTCHRRPFLTTIAPPEPACAPILVPPNNTPIS